jgi:hypothetical protein
VIELTPRSDAESVEALAGDFSNELLAQSTRAMVFAANRDLVQAIVSRTWPAPGPRWHGGGAAAPRARFDFDVEDEPFRRSARHCDVVGTEIRQEDPETRPAGAKNEDAALPPFALRAGAVSEAIAVFAEHGQVQIDDSSGDHVIVHLADGGSRR